MTGCQSVYSGHQEEGDDAGLVPNAGATAAQGRLHFWSAAGTLVTSQAFSVNLRGTHVLLTFNVPALQGASGTITLTSDAQFGALVGKAVALEPATGFSFDSPMQTRSR